MESALILLSGAVWFVFAYYWYGNVIKRNLIDKTPNPPLPSKEFYDGKDYVPTKPIVLFGHHFSSIAGAGPIVGPIIAVSLFGWLPAMLWILLGAVFFGAVHDYTSMMMSAKKKGISIAEISGEIVSSRVKNLFGIFIWVIVVLIQAVFIDLCVQTIIEDPEIVIPTFSLVTVAVLFGMLILKPQRSVVFPTFIAIALLLVIVYLSEGNPIIIDSEYSYHLWLLIIIAYTFFASILPVWVLLQPRDYLSTYFLIIGLVVGTLGILVVSPSLQLPIITSGEEAKEPIFPALFIIIACGAISGFHSLVGSGTSSKQLDREKAGKFVGFGSMLTEGFLALLVVVMVSSVLVWGAAGEGLDNSFQGLLSKSAIILFGHSFGIVAEGIGIPFLVGSTFGVLMVNAFVITTLDTSARLNRYLVQETLGTKYGGIFKNKYFATGISLFFAGLLCLSNGYKVIWPLFGITNQMIGAVALFVVTVYFALYKAPKFYTLIPAIFMFIITISATIYQTVYKFIPSENWVLLGFSIVLMFLNIIVCYEAFKKILILKSKP